MHAAVSESQLEAIDLAGTLDKGDCPSGRGVGEELPAGAADGVLLTGSPGGISWGLSQLYAKTDEMGDAGQWRGCPQCLPGSVAEHPVASGQEGAGLGCGGWEYMEDEELRLRSQVN